MLLQRCSKQHLQIQVVVISRLWGIDLYKEKYTRLVQQTGIQLYILLLKLQHVSPANLLLLSGLFLCSFLRSEQQYAERKVVGKLLLRSCVGYVEHMRHIPYTKHMWPKRM